GCDAPASFHAARRPCRFAQLSIRTRGSGGSSSSDLVSPDLEAHQRIWSERLGDWHIGRIASLGDQYTANPRDVVARIERMPAPADESLEPAGKVARPIRW